MKSPNFTRHPTSRLFIEFLHGEQASGVVLLLSMAVALMLANIPGGQGFVQFWHIKVGWHLPGLPLVYDLQHWINDGLMAVFFLLVGLEIERELYVGELSDLRSASLPVMAALGGMLVPALLYLLATWGTPVQGGFGIPMATDIAFALGVLSLLGNRVPMGLRIFLTALAIIDDLGAILLIALAYSQGLSLTYIALAIGLFLLLIALNRNGIRWLPVYLILGLGMWYAILQAGIHASIAGILLAFAIPFDQGTPSSLSYRLEHAIQKPVAFLVVPLFALANTGVVLQGLPTDQLGSPLPLGILLGLLLGKPLGIVLFSLLTIRSGHSDWPDGMSLRHLIGTGFLGGVSLTMAIFITFLAFEDGPSAPYAKLAIVVGSLLSGVVGFLILRFAPPYRPSRGIEETTF